MDGKKMALFINQYAKHPCRFVEEILGIKLHWWQKLQILFFRTEYERKALDKYIYGE